MSAEIPALLAQLAAEVIRLLPGLLRAIRDGKPAEAERLARRAALAAAARAGVRRGTRRP